MKSRGIAIISVICLCAALSSGCGDKDDGQERQIILTTGYEDGELFFIGDSKCYIPEARLYIRTLSSSYESKYGTELMSKDISGITVGDKLTSLALSRLAEVKAMGLLAAERGISLSDRDIERCIQATDRYMESLSEADIADLGMDRDLLLSMYEDYALADKVYNDITGDINPEISDDEARIVTIERILIGGTDEAHAMQTANYIYAQLSEGTSFDVLTDEYNSANESKYSFGKDTDEFSQEFVDACFDLSTDEVSGPLVTLEGVSIVKCLSSFNKDETDANKVRMVQKRKREAFDEIYSAFVKDLYSGFNDELWDEQVPTTRNLDTQEDFFKVYEEVSAGLALSY